MIDDKWLTIGDYTEGYYHANQEALTKNQSLELDFDCEISMKDKKDNDLLYDFAMKFRKGTVDCVDDYFKSLDKAKHVKLLVDCGLKRDQFE